MDRPALLKTVLIGSVEIDVFSDGRIRIWPPTWVTVELAAAFVEKRISWAQLRAVSDELLEALAIRLHSAGDSILAPSHNRPVPPPRKRSAASKRMQVEILPEPPISVT